jgi:hypothetical protein
MKRMLLISRDVAERYFEFSPLEDVARHPVPLDDLRRELLRAMRADLGPAAKAAAAAALAEVSVEPAPAPDRVCAIVAADGTPTVLLDGVDRTKDLAGFTLRLGRGGVSTVDAEFMYWPAKVAR